MTAIPTRLPAGTWSIEPSKTSLTATAKKLGFLNVAGTMAVTSGTILIDDSHKVTSVAVTANANSYNSGNSKRDTHIRSSDFLDAEASPTIEFLCTDFVETPDGLTAKGTVVVKGASSPLTVQITNIEFQADSCTFRASSAVNRNAIGVGKLPSFVIGRMLSLDVTAQARRAVD